MLSYVKNALINMVKSILRETFKNAEFEKIYILTYFDLFVFFTFLGHVVGHTFELTCQAAIEAEKAKIAAFMATSPDIKFTIVSARGLRAADASMLLSDYSGKCCLVS